MIKMQCTYGLLISVLLCNSLLAENNQLEKKLEKINSLNPHLLRSDDQMDSQRLDFAVKSLSCNESIASEWRYVFFLLSGLFIFFKLNLRYLKMKTKKSIKSKIVGVNKPIQKQSIAKPRLTY